MATELLHEVINSIEYFLVPKKFKKSSKPYYSEITKSFKPDVVHIHGTEYGHGLDFFETCPEENIVVSIQGLVSIYQRYYFGGIGRMNLIKHITLRDIVRADSIFIAQKNMCKRGLIEINLLKNVNHVIGRTEWDKCHTWAINPNANYHFCNETLRSNFYNYTWDIKNCEPYSIFLSQAHYPLKGFHQLLKALPLILSHFPKTKVYVGGNNFFTIDKWRLNGYGTLINSIIKKYHLESIVNFTGILNEDDMIDRYLKSHIFLCPSSIENSPNSVGEAQLLGVPCVASYVGGIPDMVDSGQTGLLYRFDDIEMLAKSICDIFDNNELANHLSKHGRKVAAERHNTYYK